MSATDRRPAAALAARGQQELRRRPRPARRRLRRPPRRGHRPGRRQRRRQVHAGEVHRGHLHRRRRGVPLRGQARRRHGPRDTADLGIEVVYQDLALCDNLDIVQNMFLGREKRKGGCSTSRRWRNWPARRWPPVGAHRPSSVRQPVSSLSGGQRQTVAIAKAVLWNSSVVLLDEPTAALGVAQTRQVLDLVRRLADNGLGVVLISHNLSDVFEVADRITALYLGRVAATCGPATSPAARSSNSSPRDAPATSASPTRHRRRLRRSRHDHRHRPPATEPGRAPPRRPASRSDNAQPTHRSARRVRAYVARLRGGDMGSLPAILGLVVLFVVFGLATTPSHRAQHRQPGHPGRLDHACWRWA